MTMKNPPHPGRMIRRRVLNNLNMDVKEFSERLDIPEYIIQKIINEESGITSDLAVKLENSGIGNAHHWMRMQASHDISVSKRKETNNIPKFYFYEMFPCDDSSVG